MMPHDFAVIFLNRQYKDTSLSLSRAEKRPGVTQEEITHLQNKLTAIEWLRRIVSAWKNVPTADVTPIGLARWETRERSSDGFIYHSIQCSRCRFAMNPYASGFNYCPNCGSRMEVYNGDEG